MCRMQVQVATSGVVGLNFQAILAVSEAAGLNVQAVAEFLPAIEAGMLEGIKTGAG